MRMIGLEEIEKMALGAALLGTGGGGDPYIGKLMAKQAIEKYGPVKLISYNELEDDDLVVPSAMMGAPSVMVEKIPSGDEAIAAFKELEKHLGKKITATMPIEAGGVNSLIPIALAATLGLPIVDSDGMGRAFPELQMVTFFLDGINASPMVLTDEKKNATLVNAIDGVYAEKIARSVTMVSGGSVLDAIYPMTGKNVKESAIHDTLTLEEEIGNILLSESNVIESLKNKLNGYVLFSGKIIDINRATDGGFVKGKANFEGIDEFNNQTASVEFQNENLICYVNDLPKAITPDLITVLDKETGMPITTEGLQFGMRIVILGMPADEKWRTQKAIDTVGPRYFGYDLDYKTIESLNGGNENV